MSVLTSLLACAEGRAMISFFVIQPIIWLFGVYNCWYSSSSVLSSIWFILVVFGPVWAGVSYVVQRLLASGPKLAQSCQLILKNKGLEGKTALVTGCNTGIGFIVAKEFAKGGATVIMACRSEKRMEEARNKILAEVGADAKDRLITVVLDLNSFSKTHDAVTVVQNLLKDDKIKGIDFLINNAGLFFPTVDYIGDKAGPRGVIGQETFETNIHVNHLAPVIFTEGILPILKHTAKAGRQVRIINVASGAHNQIATPEGALNPKQRHPPPHAALLKRFHNPVPTAKKSPTHNGGLEGSKYQLYGLSKACNIFYAKYLTKRFHQSSDVAVQQNMKAVSLHPGFIMTEVFRRLPENTQAIMSKVLGTFVMKTVPQGANTTLTAALQPWAELEAGAYYVDSAPSANGVSWGPGDNDKTIPWEDVNQVMEFSFNAVKMLPAKL